jgi:ribosomal protein L3 glutamine methyltransferase
MSEPGFLAAWSDDQAPPAEATVLDHIRVAQKALERAGVSFGHGTSNAFDEAVWLVLWRIGHPLDDLESVQNKPLSPAQSQAVATLLKARISTRKPAAYLTQEAWLQGVPFYVDERAIVPRSLIAELMANATLDGWLHPDTHHVLDLCTGNGSLAVIAALTYPDVVVDAIDISADALAVARINVDKHDLQDRITLIEADGLNAASVYDLILCNPPYVNAHSMAELPPEYQAEPELALAGGEDGMDFIRTLLQQAPQHLSEHGVLVLEIGNERAYFEAAFPHLSPTWLMTSAGQDQVLLLQRDDLSENLI